MHRICWRGHSNNSDFEGQSHIKNVEICFEYFLTAFNGREVDDLDKNEIVFFT